MRIPRKSERARLLRVAKAVLWLGVVWNFSWWGYAIWESRQSLSLSDAIEDATPLFFLGGIGFGAAVFVGWIIRNRAKRRARRGPHRVERATSD